MPNNLIEYSMYFGVFPEECIYSDNPAPKYACLLKTIMRVPIRSIDNAMYVSIIKRTNRIVYLKVIAAAMAVVNKRRALDQNVTWFPRAEPRGSNQ